MPQKDKIELYRSITAPESLKERVLTLENPGKRKASSGLRVLAAVAAVVVIAASAFAYFGYADIEVASTAQSADTSSVTGNAPALARSLAYETVVFDVESNSETTVTVTVGELSACSGDEEAAQVGSSISINGKVTFKWNFAPADVQNGTATVELRTLGRTKIYVLETNEAGYTLRLEK